MFHCCQKLLLSLLHLPSDSPLLDVSTGDQQQQRRTSSTSYPPEQSYWHFSLQSKWLAFLGVSGRRTQNIHPHLNPLSNIFQLPHFASPSVPDKSSYPPLKPLSSQFLLSVLMMFLISWIFAFVAFGLAFLIYFYTRHTSPGTKPGKLYSMKFIPQFTNTVFPNQPNLTWNRSVLCFLDIPYLTSPPSCRSVQLCLLQVGVPPPPKCDGQCPP